MFHLFLLNFFRLVLSIILAYWESLFYYPKLVVNFLLSNFSINLRVNFLLSNFLISSDLITFLYLHLIIDQRMTTLEPIQRHQPLLCAKRSSFTQASLNIEDHHNHSACFFHLGHEAITRLFPFWSHGTISIASSTRLEFLQKRKLVKFHLSYIQVKRNNEFTLPLSFFSVPTLDPFS